MIYKAHDLYLRMKHLVLAGQNEDGELEFIGTQDKWRKVDEPGPIDYDLYDLQVNFS